MDSGRGTSSGANIKQSIKHDGQRKLGSLTLREQHRLRVFENRVLRRIFGSKRNEVTGGWRKLHNEEFHNLYSSPSTYNYNDQVKEDEMGRACSINGGEEECI
jgi:hypothetical protein